MESLKLARLSHASDLVIGVEEVLNFSKLQVKVDISVGLQVVVLDVLAEEAKDFILDLSGVAEGFLSHCEALWHAQLPFKLVYSCQES